MLVKEESSSKDEKLNELTQLNTLLKDEYNALNLTYSCLEKNFQQTKVRSDR